MTRRMQPAGGVMSLASPAVTARRPLRRIVAFSIFGALGLAAASGQSDRGTAAVARTPESILISDNRTAAGTLNDGSLTVRVDARIGQWHPDADTGPAVQVKAFAVDGGQLQIPGPLIRVTEGTEIWAVVRNS